MNLQKHLSQLNCYAEIRLQNDKQIGTSLTSLTKDTWDSDDSGISARVFNKGVWGMAHATRADENTLQALTNKALSNADILADLYAIAKTYSLAKLAFNGYKLHEEIHPGERSANKTHLLEAANFFKGYISKNCPGLDDYYISAWLSWDEKMLAVTTGAQLYTLLPKTTLQVRLTLRGFQLEKSYYAQDDLSFLEAKRDEICRDIYSLYEHLRNKTQGIFIDDAYAHCILSPRMASKIIHEALGHHAEGDFVLNSFPHSPFVMMPSLHPKVNVIDYANTAFGEKCPLPIYIDDEGVAAQDVQLIKSGRVSEFMTNRETAYQLESPLTGNARAASYKDEPLARMRNTALLPGTDSLKEMIASVDEGYYLVDGADGDGELNGDFAYQVSIAYRIKNGKLCESVKDAVVWGDCINFMRSISMIGNDFEWHMDDCTKLQKINLSAGAPSIKARLSIGVM